MKKIILSILFYFSVAFVFAQEIKIQVTNAVTGDPVNGASISKKNKSFAITDSMGMAMISISGTSEIEISAVGFQAFVLKTKDYQSSSLYSIKLTPSESEMEDIIIVASTRSNQNIENAPIKIEILDAEEMQEESAVKPASVLGIIGDISGVQIQQVSAVSGNSNVRIQGLDGRYTQVLRDGLPLYESFSGGFGLMSIPPLDLKQVELIKGSASTLYGAGAIGGLVNLISKKPTAQQEGIFTINQTTLKESNLNSFFSKRYKKFGYTFYVGATNQSAVDVNKDGFSDVSRTKSFVVHPRLFFYPDNKTTITAGFTSTNDSRLGGDMKVIENKADSVHQFFEKNKISRNSAELLAERNFSGKNKFVLKGSVSDFKREITTQDFNFNAGQLDYFSEASILINQKNHNWVGGVNFSGNQFKKISGDSSYINKVNNNTVGAFLQYAYKFKSNTSLEMGLRNDYHMTYGNFVLPRVSFFHQLNKKWGTRTGFGAGYKIPDALAPQINDYAIVKLLPIGSTVKPERSYGYNAEVNYKTKWGEENSIFINHAFFLTQLNNPVIAKEQSNGTVSFANASKPIITKGFDTYIKLNLEGWELYAGYTYTIAERKYLADNQFVPLTPKFRMSYMLTREWEGKARFCVESSFNGYQYRQDYTKTPSYLFLASMIDYTITKQCHIILNCENILDYRQSKKEALYTGSISNPQFNALWAPIDGRVVNLCLRLSL
jgi:iron complex outermembrane receptor protein/outer membrane receptor for ferrienterochelin and colicins